MRSLASGKPEHLKQLGELCQDLEFRAKVEAAVKDSSSKEAAEVLKILNPLIRTSGGKIDYSASARAAGLTTLYSYTQFFGCPSVFFTIAPDDTHSVLAIRLSIPTKSNQGFPARDEGLLNHLLEGAQTHDLCKIDISEFGLQKLMAENPVAAAEIFMQIQLAIYTILLGISPEKSSKKTRPLGVFRGIFGNCKAVFSVVETQGRLSLHVHMAVWAGLLPHLLQKAAAFPEFVEEIAEVLNQHFQGQLPDGYHVQALHRLATEPKQRPKQDPPRMCYVPCPIPDETPAGEAFVHHFRTTMNRVGIHAHSSTCEKGGSGKEGCRLAFPRAFCNQTGPVQLIPLEKLEFQVLNDVIREQPMERDFLENPLTTLDTRCIYWDIQRARLNLEEAGAQDPQLQETLESLNRLSDANVKRIVQMALPLRNLAVVETSPIACALLACNTNSLAVIKYAAEKIGKYPSKAEDTGTDLRTGMHLLTVVHNKFNGLTEISDTQAAAALLGMPAQEGSMKTTFVFIQNAITAVKKS